MNDEYVYHYELDGLQNQIYDLISDIRDLTASVERLTLENELLRNDINTLKTEGCWRFVENAKHEHR